METKVSKAILHEPVKFSIHTRGFLRLCGIKKMPVSIYPLYYGTMVKISGKLALLRSTTTEDFEKQPVMAGYTLIGQNAKTVSLMIAYAMLNGRFKILLFSRLVANMLYWRLNAKESEAIMSIILEQTNITDFLTTIISLRGLNVTKPREEMSPNGTGETIAPTVL